jgi:hypothetical protein
MQFWRPAKFSPQPFIEAKFMRADPNIRQKFWAPRDRLPVNGKIDAFA